MVMGLIKGGDLWAVIHREQDDGSWYSGIPEDHAKFYCLLIADTIVRARYFRLLPSSAMFSRVSSFGCKCSRTISIVGTLPFATLNQRM